MILLIITSSLLYSLIAYSDTGWTSASGTSAKGKAINITDVGNGYTFYCVGTGTCFMIIGNTLIIEEGIGTGGISHGVFRN